MTDVQCRVKCLGSLNEATQTNPRVSKLMYCTSSEQSTLQVLLQLGEGAGQKSRLIAWFRWGRSLRHRGSQVWCAWRPGRCLHVGLGRTVPGPRRGGRRLHAGTDPEGRGINPLWVCRRFQRAARRPPRHESSRNLVVKPLLSLGEADHQEADAKNQYRYELRPVSAVCSTEAKPLPALVGHV